LDYSWLFKKFVGIISHFYGKFKGQIVASKWIWYKNVLSRKLDTFF
jgi:hypothetical protein